MLTRWKKISSKLKYENKYWTYLIDQFTIDDSKEFEYHYVHTLGSTMIIPQLANGKFILVEQYRYLNDMFSLEFPCGSIEKGFSKIENAKKELIEETGYTSDNLVEIGFFSPYNGVGDEICTVYYASQLENIESKPEETEKFVIHQLTEDEIDTKLINNEIWDGMSISAWTFFKNKISVRK